MAIDRNKTRELIANIDEFFDSVTGGLPEEARGFLQRSVMGPAVEEVRKLIDQSRPPVLFLAGRSGHGKSSLINALAGREVAEVGDIKPTTPESTPYLIPFHEQFSAWQVIDSRGIFETTRPDGAVEGDTAQILRDDLRRYNPDVILHVIAAPEIRNLAMDLQFFQQTLATLKQESGVSIPVIVVLSKADALGNPREWPPEVHAKKAALISEALDYMARDVLRLSSDAYEQIDRNFPFYGLVARSTQGEEAPKVSPSAGVPGGAAAAARNSSYVPPDRPAVIPLCALPDDAWNVENLADYIGQRLPEAALLDYYQALRRREKLRKISSSIIKRFAVIASGVGASPIPLSDVFVITPLQILMLAIIGGLSCRPVSRETASEYLSAIGLNLLTAGGTRYIAQQLAKFIPFAGWAASSTLAGSSTYALGKAAEAYFFSGEVHKPDSFRKEFEKRRNLIEAEVRREAPDLPQT